MVDHMSQGLTPAAILEFVLYSTCNVKQPSFISGRQRGYANIVEQEREAVGHHSG